MNKNISKTDNIPLEEIKDPPHLIAEEEKISKKQQDLDRETLIDRQEFRRHKKILFYSTLIVAGVLYLSGIVFAVCSTQLGVAYFMGIFAFMTPATLITSVLLTRIIHIDQDKNENSSTTLIMLGNIIRDILKGLNKHQ